jgi:hypothetical protein
MSSDQPHFRFNPGAYAEGRSFERSGEACHVCTKPCVWEYTGGIYALSEPRVCARCIAAGRLGSFLGDVAFALHDVLIEDAEPALAQELLQRTPGFACFNPFDWPVLDAKPLAFLGHGDEAGLFAIPDVRTAISEAFEPFGWDCAPSPYALIFKEIDGERYRVSVDLD